MSQYHAKDGWFFERLGGGSVCIVKREPATGDGAVVAKIVIEPDSWVSIVASVSADQDSAASFYAAREIHLHGKVSQFVV